MNVFKKKDEAAIKREQARLRKIQMKHALYSKYEILKERSLYSKEFLKRGDMAEKDPLYAITDPEDMKLQAYYSEIPIDPETFSKLNATSKAFIKKFIKDNYTGHDEGIKGVQKDKNFKPAKIAGRKSDT